MLFVLALLFFVAASNFFTMGEYTQGVVLALLCAVCVAYGIHRMKQKKAQSQAQQQTVVVNNYITQSEPQQYMKVNHIEAKDEDDLPKQ